MEMQREIPEKRRPYWHVDAKWISGIFLFFALSSALLLYSLSVLTQRDNATTISATVIAGMFSKEGADTEAGLNELRRQAEFLPGEVVAPLPQFPTLEISKQELLTKNAEELKVSLFRQLTESIYDKGVVGAAEELTPNQADQEKFAHDAVLLGGFTKGMHDTIQGAFIVSVLAATILMGVFIYFSAGWGRVANPGVMLLTVSPVGALVGLLLTNRPTDGDAPLLTIPDSVARQVGESLTGSYGLAAVAGAGLLVVALVGKVAHVIYKRNHKPEKTQRHIDK